jgi:diguanylate cyclase (GGDEF)-like protein
MDFLASLEKRSKPFWIVIGFVLIGGVGILDFQAGYEFRFSLLYLIPISLVTWLTGRRLGIVASLASALVRLISEAAAGNPYSQQLINTLIGLSIFVIITLLLSALRKALEHERELAQTDYLTGAMNSRSFFDLIQTEINRVQRYEHPFTIAYIDIDNFKTVNDRLGHTTGDQVLRAVVNQARAHMRKTDVVARLGGDEFALLLPETDPESAQVVLSKIRNGRLVGMQQSKWPVTFSIGVLTCIDAPPTPDELFRMVDELMYSVKRGSKNAIKYSTLRGPTRGFSRSAKVEN